MIRVIDATKDILVLRGRCGKCFVDLECDDEDSPEGGFDTGYPWRESLSCPLCGTPVRFVNLKFPIRSSQNKVDV